MRRSYSNRDKSNSSSSKCYKKHTHNIKRPKNNNSKKKYFYKNISSKKCWKDSLNSKDSNKSLGIKEESRNSNINAR